MADLTLTIILILALTLTLTPTLAPTLTLTLIRPSGILKPRWDCPSDGLGSWHKQQLGRSCSRAKGLAAPPVPCQDEVYRPRSTQDY